MKFLGVIPARSGSKRLPGKNVRLCNGKPLIGWTCEAAIKSGVIDLCIVSTDSTEIMETAQKYGVAAPFKRPANLANDHATSWGVVKHALDWADKFCDDQNHPRFDAVILLQPTSPLRNADDISKAVSAMEESQADTVVSVVEVPKNLSVSKMMVFDKNKGSLAALDYGKGYNQVYLRDGPSILITHRDTINLGNLYGAKVMPTLLHWNSFVDIDLLEDFQEAERRLIEMTEPNQTI